LQINQTAEKPTPQEEQNQDDEDEEEKPENPESYKELIMWKYKDQIQEMIRNNPRSILIGGTGTGKTKETPKFIRELLKPGEMLVVTEPTQINVESLAKKVAEEEGVAEVVEDPTTKKKETILGKEIGFQHGGGRKLHDENDTRFMTEGTLLRQIKADKRIPNVRYLMIDEVHIQSKLTEQLIERALEAQRLRQQDVDNGVAGATPLTILFTSATVDKEKLEKKCNAGQVLDVPAAERKYKITPYYETRDLSDDQKAERAAEIIEEYLKKGMKGDFAQAVASIKDIDKYAAAIKRRGLDVEIHKVHSNSTDEAKAEVSRKRGKKEKQRVMIGTGFIQTGVTMPNLEVIINSGDQIAMELDPKTGLIYPKRVKQTQAEIKQWAGRVGRVGPGDVRNLFTEADEAARPEYPQPEMTRSDLTDLVLQVKAQKEKKIEDYNFLSAPLSPERIAFANETLNLLGALNTDGSLNAIGERMAEIPADFHSARMIVAAEQQGKGVEQICTIAAMSENSSSIFTEKIKVLNRFGNTKSDFLTYLAIWRGYEKNSDDAAKKKWCEDAGIVYPAMVKIEKNRERLLNGAKNKSALEASEDELGKYVAAGFNDKQMQYDPTKSTAKRSAYRWLRGHATDVIVYIDRDSSIPTTTMHQYLVTGSNGEIREDEKTKEKYVFISNCQVVQPGWLSTPLPLVA
jgi:HrpA-like RNA helicase